MAAVAVIAGLLFPTLLTLLVSPEWKRLGFERYFEMQAGNGDVVAVGVDRWQLLPRGQCDDQLAMDQRLHARGSAIRPSFDPRANAATARSMSVASRKLIGLISTPNDGATDWIAPI